MNPPSHPLSEADKSRDRSVVHSALWSAAGDALGWITELSRGPSGVAHRTGASRVTEPVDWQRLIGGKYGPRVGLPAGTYSDDTQLRLAVCRSIRGDGSFDAETFGKIELTVWPTYALGGGLGTKAAALNLSRRSVNWFSNFFDSAGQKYISGGGNGAAMRIQPHVWASSKHEDQMLLNIMRDALVTHGHPHGFCGAVFHALCLNEVIRTRRIPEPQMWLQYIERFKELNHLIRLDPQLAAFWLSTWEHQVGAPLADAIEKMAQEARSDVAIVSKYKIVSGDASYHQCLEELGCLSPQFRGSGFKTGLAAAALAYAYRAEGPGAALVAAANELESDTDTIATMAGALLGAISDHPPGWPVQDREYIAIEAQRLAAIGRGETQDSFSYPDVGHWNPPTKQTASVGWREGKLAILGLGFLEPLGEEYESGDAIWQWFALPFGQSILAKRKTNLKDKIGESQLPGPRRMARLIASPNNGQRVQSRLPFEDAEDIKNGALEKSQAIVEKRRDDIDSWTDAVIRADFNDVELGRFLNRCIDVTGSVDSTVAFAAIIAKAKLARKRRR